MAVKVGQFVKISDGQAMAAVKCGKPAISTLVQKVLGARTAAAGHEDLGHVIYEFGVGVGAADQQSMREGPLHLELAGMINRVTAIGPRADKAEIGIGEQLVAVRVGADSGIEILIDKEVF